VGHWDLRVGRADVRRRAQALLVAFGLLVAGGAIASPAQAAANITVRGKLLNLPRHQRGLSVVVEAVSLNDAEAASADTVKGSAYSLSVQAGPYLILETVFDPRKRRTKVAYKAVSVKPGVGSVNLTVHGALARLPLAEAAAAAAASNTNVGVGNIPINAPEGRLPGGATAGLVNGLLPVCHARGAKVYDETSAFQDALRAEQQLEAQHLLDVNFTYSTPAPGFLIVGSVDTGHNGGPRADITLFDKNTGEKRRFIVAGDPDSWDKLGDFMTHVGSSIGNNIADHQIACDKAKEPPPPPPPSSACQASQGTVCVAFSGEASGDLKSPHTVATDRNMKTLTFDLVWTAHVKGYGVPTDLSPSSSATGTGTVTYNNATTCDGDFYLDRYNAPSLAQGAPFNSTTELTIEVPNPTSDSAGTGTGNPAIGVTNGCPALLSAGPGNFTITVPLVRGTVRNLPITDDDIPISGPYGASGTSSLDGTITVEVG
jgi:hypothetical protein